MQKIGRYQIEHELGRGAMGVVYRAYDPAIGRRVAVKTIHLDQLSDPQATAQLRERLLREAQAAGILSHPNIVTIYDIAEDSANAYIFMEYVEGATLDSFARGMPVDDFLDLLEQAAHALDYAHSKGIVHRDIKPANLMLAGPKLKITDFGVARLRSRDTNQSSSLLGTPSYMSPEQISAGEVTGASDQYSLAVIAYEFLAGSKPFENDNLGQLLFKIAHEAPAPVASLSPKANDVLGQALAKDPTRRFRSCTEFAEALSLSLGHVTKVETPARAMTGDEPTISNEPNPLLNPVPLPPARAIHDTPIPEPRFRSSLFLIFFALVAAGGAALWYYLGPQASQPVETKAPSVAEQTKPSAVGDPVPPAPEPQKNEPPTPEPPPTTPPAAPAATAQQNEVKGANSYEISFASDPEGAEILVNDGNVDRCRSSPCTLELPAGVYRITAKLQGFPDQLRSLRVPDSTAALFRFDRPEGMLSIVSNPPGASIRLDGREILEKTPAMLKLKPGTYRLEVIKEGLPSQSREVTVSNGTVQTFSVKWN